MCTRERHFESSDGYGWILSFSDAKSELIDEIYSSEGLALLGMPKPSDIIVTFRINENFHATTTDIDLEFRDQNTEFSVRSRYSQYNSVNKKPIYDEDYEKVDDLRPMLLLSHKISTALTEEEGKFTLNVRDEIQGRFTSEYDAYTERDTVIFKNTENGFEYDVTAMLDNEYYRIVFEDGRQTVTNSNNESSTISSSEAHAFVFILGLLDSANFNETEVKNITALPFDQYEFTCETNDKSYFVELIEALDDTYVNHTMQITVTIKDGEIEEINSVIKITGRNYIRTVKTGVKFSEIDK